MPPDVRRQELELLFLTMFAAVPLYGTQTITAAPLIVFHLVMLAIGIRVARGKSPELIPAPIMRALGVGYVLFYVIDAAVISRSAIAASTHLVLFIAAYQPMESAYRRNHGQRLLTATLLFIASLATATHIAIIPYVIAFAFLLFRQLIHMSHIESAAVAHAAATEPPSARAASFYVTATTAVAVVLFPMLPRVRSPIVPGMASALNNASTGLSDTIDLNKDRTITPDATVVSRVWMGQEAVPFFTPLRLRGTVYERFSNNKWLQRRLGFVRLERHDNATRIARPSGFTRRATIQQRLIIGDRLFLPSGTYEVIGPPIAEGPTRDVFSIGNRADMVSYDVRLARSTAPLRAEAPQVVDYPVTPAIAALARQIVGAETDPLKQAGSIERYMSSRFQYIADPSTVGPMTVDQFLLRTRRGHCEYFAAGMVALMSALHVPARIVGGFYGGQFNPLAGYFVIRRADAHAWVEVWSGDRWETFDPTPASLRPGAGASGIGAYASALGDSVNYFWDRYILTFGLGDQIALAADAIARVRAALGHFRHTARSGLSGLLGLRSAFAAAGTIAFILLVVWVSRRRRSAFQLLRDHLRLRGIEVTNAMTLEEALRELRTHDRNAAEELRPLIALYEESRFSGHADERRLMTLLRRRLPELAR